MMQVEPTQTTTPYVNEIKKNESTSNTTFDITKPFDINTFSFEDYKSIGSKDLDNWIKSGNHTEDTYNSALMLNAIASYTEDDTLNKVLFDKAKSGFNSTGTLDDFNKNFRNPILMASMQNDNEKQIEIALAKAIKANPEAFEKYTNQSPVQNSTEKDSFNQKSNLIDLINGFSNFYEQTKDNTVWTTDIDSIFKYMDDILNEYEKRANENNATLDNYTKNNKPNALA